MTQENIQLNYLYKLENQFAEIRNSHSKQVDRYRSLLFIFSLSVIAFLLLGFRIEEVTFLGVKIKDFDFSKVSLTIPIILTYLYCWYSYNRLLARSAGFSHESLKKEIDMRIGLDREALKRANPYISRRGTKYDTDQNDYFHSATLIILRSVLWLPFIIALSTGIYWSIAAASGINSTLPKTLYIICISACIIAIAGIRIASIFAYRITSEKHEFKDNKAVNITTGS